MSSPFVNPISMSFALLEQYREFLQEALRQEEVTEEEICYILERIEVDRGVFLSMNRQYRSGSTSFLQFCWDQRLAEGLAERFPYLTGPLYSHQEKAINAILRGTSTIISTGTGSGKTESFLIPILHHCMMHDEPGVKALIIYPMNALANDQMRRLQEAAGDDVSYGLFVGSSSDEEKAAIRDDPPDILLTNYVMLDWMLTRTKDQSIFTGSKDSLRYIVLDELHTYRGNKAAHLKWLLARLCSKLDVPPVFIGTSATLQSSAKSAAGAPSIHPYQEGYLKGDPSDALNKFIKPLLGVDTYLFVEPEFKDLTPAQAPDPFVPPRHSANLDWTLHVDANHGREQLGNLLDKHYAPSDLSGGDWFSDTPLYQDLQRTQFLRRLRQQFLQEGAQSFLDVVALTQEILDEANSSLSAEAVAKAYLSAIAWSNHLVADDEEKKPLLDFRLHLFVQNVDGYLKRCLHCRTYHSGYQEFCQECGYPLFLVYRHDVNQCIGKVSGNQLKWEVRPESNDRTNSYYVLVTLAPDAAPPTASSVTGGPTLTFDEAILPDLDAIPLQHEAAGRLHLALLPGMQPTDIDKIVIHLVQNGKSHQYLHQLSQALLDFLPPDQKKLLGFVDNREHVSRYGMVMQDEFADRFFRNFLAMEVDSEWEYNLDDTWRLLKRRQPASDNLSADEQALFDEMEVWYHRHIATPPRMEPAMSALLQLKEVVDCTERDREVLEIFLTERALHRTPPQRPGLPRFVRFRDYLAYQQPGIYIAEGESSNDPHFPGTALTPQGRKYGEFVRALQEVSVKQMIHSLVERGFLVEQQTPDGKSYYYLSPRHVTFAPRPDASFPTYAALRDNCFLTAQAHSSEVADASRRAVEENFHKGALNLVMATSTLEMGIDIGKLQAVLLVGVPPMPSNYAQRAGRAGRGNGHNYALITTFCQDSNEHDRYYFQHPKRMINGLISPPTFAPDNLEVIKKHLHAFVVGGNADDPQRLLWVQAAAHQEEKRAEVRALFGDAAATYYAEVFPHQLREAMKGKSGHGGYQWHFYANGFFPDYSFRRDQVYVVDTERVDQLSRNQYTLEQLALSAREPESAYYKFVPDKTLFMAGDAYTLSAQGKWHTLVGAPGTRVMRSYQYMLAHRADRLHSKDAVRQRFLTTATFQSTSEWHSKGEVLHIAYDPACRLQFVNGGVLQYDSIEAFEDTQGTFNIGYAFNRAALLLRFDKEVCPEPLYLSLVSALDRTIKDRYGLDESEIRVLTDCTPLTSAPIRERQEKQEKAPYHYVLLYDFAGSGAVPLDKIYQDFDGIVHQAYHTLHACTIADGTPCETGCYACLKSYALHYYAYAVNKPTATMFLGYLLDKNPFRPALVPLPASSLDPDLVLTLVRHGSRFVVRASTGREYERPNEEQNGAIFEALAAAVQTEFRAEMKALRIESKESYVVDAINAGNLNKSRDAFSRFQFESLRFDHVEATPYQ